MRARQLAWCFFALGACATARPEPLTLSIQNLMCSDCGTELEAKARSVHGVQEAHFDATRVELELKVAPGTPTQPIVGALDHTVLDGRPITALVGAGQGSYAPFAAPDPSWDVKVLSAGGEDVADLAREASPGKVTVVDFYAAWCGPCHLLDDHMHQLLSADRDLAYRRVNVVDWESPVARHYLGNVRELPYVLVLDGRGRTVAALSAPSNQTLDEGIRKAKAE